MKNIFMTLSMLLSLSSSFANDYKVYDWVENEALSSNEAYHIINESDLMGFESCDDGVEPKSLILEEAYVVSSNFVNKKLASLKVDYLFTRSCWPYEIMCNGNFTFSNKNYEFKESGCSWK
ncbi:MAG: hypothetical protein N4A33_03460 [Bacteriovoracaceae bacterium]|jgi:hypothetical protein|nr:hypothetical protein [Bacteriovoracaceae bacterium]